MATKLHNLPQSVLLSIAAICSSLCFANYDATAEEVTHSFLACGAKTRIVDEKGVVIWSYPQATRDGYVLENGNVILTLKKSKSQQGGAVVEITPDGSETLIWEGTQAEVNGAQPTDSETFVITEAGPNPRLVEVDRSGAIQVEFPLQCQKPRHHMQTRMARKLTDGTYLAPHLLDFAVKHYDASGKLIDSLSTAVPGDSKRDIHSWPFTAIRHDSNHTLVCCTNGNRVVDYNNKGEIAWQLTNEDFDEPWLQDPCGGQLLPNGNIVVASYAAGRKDVNAPKLIEVNRDKEVVWTYSDGATAGIHHFQILTTNGARLVGYPMK